MGKPAGSLSVDLDNQWSYMKSGGIAGWQDFPSYLEIAVPRMMSAFDKRGIKVTVFVVGQDAALPKNRAVLRSIAEAGHEIGNHSFHHEPWLNLKSGAEIAAELRAAHDAISVATGVVPSGFRGPGFSLSRGVLDAVAGLGYGYDASTFPTFVGPLARAYYFVTSSFDAEQRAERARLFGSVSDGLRPLSPYRWRLADRALIEMPVTTFPFVRMPFHFSYLSFAAGYSAPGALTYFRAALLACRAEGIAPSFLLHPLDFLGGEEVPILSGFPGMKLNRARKQRLMDQVLDLLCEQFVVGGVGVQAKQAGLGSLGLKTPNFAVDRGQRNGTMAGAAS